MQIFPFAGPTGYGQGEYVDMADCKRGVGVKPVKRRAVMWYSLTAAGHMDGEVIQTNKPKKKQIRIQFPFFQCSLILRLYMEHVHQYLERNLERIRFVFDDIFL